MNKVKRFEDLTCWKKSRELKRLLYKLAKDLPQYEQFRLASQIRGSASSTTSNIAEGFGRFNYQEKIYFARLSRASTLESEDHLYTCLDAEYIDQDRFNFLYQKCEEVSVSINGYISFIYDMKNDSLAK